MKGNLTKLKKLLILVLLFVMMIQKVTPVNAQLIDIGMSVYEQLFDNGDVSIPNHLNLLLNRTMKNTTTDHLTLMRYIGHVSDAVNKCFQLPNDMQCKNGGSSYVVQGLCYNTYKGVTYTLISAYSRSNQDKNAVVFVTEDGQNYTKVIFEGKVLHFGGIASAGDMIYVTGKSGQILRVSDKDFFAMYKNSLTLKNNGNIKRVCTLQSYKIKTLLINSEVFCSFLNYDKEMDMLWVGNWAEDEDTSFMYAYSEDTLSKAESTKMTTYSYKMKIPTYTQGMSVRKIDDEQWLFLTRSCSVKPNAKFTSELYCYRGYGFSENRWAYISETDGEPAFKYMLPPMAEGVHIGETYTYIIFETNAGAYRGSSLVCDYALAAKTADLLYVATEDEKELEELEEMIQETEETEENPEEPEDNPEEPKDNPELPVVGDDSEEMEVMQEEIDFEKMNEEDNSVSGEEISEESLPVLEDTEDAAKQTVSGSPKPEFSQTLEKSEQLSMIQSIYGQLKTYYILQQMYERIFGLIEKESESDI